jgi:hypothetical protein
LKLLNKQVHQTVNGHSKTDSNINAFPRPVNYAAA